MSWEQPEKKKTTLYLNEGLWKSNRFLSDRWEATCGKFASGQSDQQRKEKLPAY